MLMNIKITTQFQGWGPSLASIRTYQNIKAIKEVGSFLIVKQINVMVFQLQLLGSMKIHPMFHVSCWNLITHLPF